VIVRSNKPDHAPAEAPAVPDTPAAPRFPGLAVFRGPLTLLVASLVLIGVGVGLTIAAAQLRGSQSAVNRALTDPAATRQVIAAVSADVSDIYSYSYTDIGTTEQAAQRILAGQAAAQYHELFPMLREAASEQLTVVTRVEQAGVSRLSGNTAQLLVFMDQTATRGHDKGTSVPAQLAITARFSGGQWRITSIEAR
jgi:Mce-associated membrane protein